MAMLFRYARLLMRERATNAAAVLRAPTAVADMRASYMRRYEKRRHDAITPIHKSRCCTLLDDSAMLDGFSLRLLLMRSAALRA